MFNFLALLDIKFLVAYITIVASDWPRTFFTPKVFLFSIVCTSQFIKIYLKTLMWMVPISKMQLLTSVPAYIMASWPPLSHKKFN